jgi:hypothetical protein
MQFLPYLQAICPAIIDLHRLGCLRKQAPAVQVKLLEQIACSWKNVHEWPFLQIPLVLKKQVLVGYDIVVILSKFCVRRWLVLRWFFRFAADSYSSPHRKQFGDWAAI